MTAPTRTAVRLPKSLQEQRNSEHDRLELVLPRLCVEFGDDAYLAQLNADGYRAETMAIYAAETHHWADWLQRHRPGVTAAAATAGHIEAYRDDLANAGLSSNTIRLALASLRVFYDFLDRHSDQEQRNPAREVPLPARVNVPIGRYRREQAIAILSAAADAARTARRLSDQTDHLLAAHDDAMLACLHFSGLRRGELRRLRINDIDFQHGQLRARGKGGTARTVAIPVVQCPLLRAYLHDVRGDAGLGQFLFLELASSRELGSSDGQPQWYAAGPDSQNRLLPPAVVAKIEAEDGDYGLGPYALYQRAYLYGRLAGVDGPHGSHRWRDTHAAMCAEAGMTLEGIAARLGHDLDRRQNNLGFQPTTLTYISVSDAYLRAVVEQALPDPLRRPA